MGHKLGLSEIKGQVQKNKLHRPKKKIYLYFYAITSAGQRFGDAFNNLLKGKRMEDITFTSDPAHGFLFYEVHEKPVNRQSTYSAFQSYFLLKK